MRHVWGGRNESGFPKDKMNKTCFYKQEMKKEKKQKSKIKIAILLSPLFHSDVLIPIQFNSS
jgi:hypothetical protein